MGLTRYGQKGQKGAMGLTRYGQKGQKGIMGLTGEKGQKGDFYCSNNCGGF